RHHGVAGLDSDYPPAVDAAGKFEMHSDTLYLGVAGCTPRPDRVDDSTVGMEYGHARVGDDGVGVTGFAERLLIHFEQVEDALGLGDPHGDLRGADMQRAAPELQYEFGAFVAGAVAHRNPAGEVLVEKPRRHFLEHFVEAAARCGCHCPLLEGVRVSTVVCGVDVDRNRAISPASSTGRSRCG